MPLVAAADVAASAAAAAAAAAEATAEAEAALTPEERRTRAQVRAIQRASLAGAKQKELRRALGRAPTESEWAASLGLSSAAALRVAMEQGARAREELAQGWRGLVHKLVARHATFLPPSELEDLADEGFAGLMEAALRFKPGQAAFSTYAFYWVRKRVLSAVAARDRTTFQSLGEHALGSKVQQAMKAGFEATGRSPALAEVAAAVGVTEARAAELLRKGRRYQLLEATTSGYVRFADTLSDPEAPGADGALEAVYLAEVEEGVARAIAGLPAEERTVLGLRLGLTDGQPKSWEELSRVMDGCSVSYLRKLEARAKTHLRRNVEVMKLLHRRPPSLFGEATAGAALW
jgi:RNA polymerase sigma factor (sigma-70 family)